MTSSRIRRKYLSTCQAQQRLSLEYNNPTAGETCTLGPSRVLVLTTHVRYDWAIPLFFSEDPERFRTKLQSYSRLASWIEWAGSYHWFDY